MKKIYVYFCIAVLFLCSVLAVESSQAVNYDEKIREAEQDKKDSNQHSEEIQKEIEEIEESRKDTLAYIEKLDKKSEDVEEELRNVKKKISRMEKKLGKAEKERDEMAEVKERQYDTMKRRIKYMYENGSQEYIEILMGAGNVSDLLNRTEYIEKISLFDKNIFVNYEETVNKLSQVQEDIENQLTELTGWKEEAMAKKNALADLRRKKKKEMKKYDKALKRSQNQAGKYARQAAAAEAEVERLIQARQDEIDKKNASGSGDSGVTSDGTFRWPLNVAGRISSNFGSRSAPTAGASSYHRGIDIAVSSGTPILASGSGKVVTANYSSSAGNYVMISHGDRLYTVYMHCSRLAVHVGDEVQKGEVIAYVGSTGISTGAHLHFGVSKNGSYVDPLKFVKR